MLEATPPPSFRRAADIVTPGTTAQLSQPRWWVSLHRLAMMFRIIVAAFHKMKETGHTIKFAAETWGGLCFDFFSLAISPHDFVSRPYWSSSDGQRRCIVLLRCCLRLPISAGATARMIPRWPRTIEHYRLPLHVLAIYRRHFSLIHTLSLTFSIPLSPLQGFSPPLDADYFSIGTVSSYAPMEVIYLLRYHATACPR